MKASLLGPIIGTVCIVGILAATLAPYGGNPAALFHYGTDQSTNDLPTGFIVLDERSYDGAMYQRMANQLPLFFSADGRTTLAALQPGPYAYQRILLPVIAGLLALGVDNLLPWTFLLVNVAALIAAGFLLARRRNALGVLALMLCPAALLGLHFSLAEPLTILLLTAFLLRVEQSKSVGWIGAVLLSLAVLTREVNILFVGFTFVWLAWNKRWRDMAWLLVPIATFAAWHGVIHAIFGEWPFFWSADKRDLPLHALWEILSGEKGYNAYTLSSVALLLGFVLPSFVWGAWQVVRRKDLSLATLGACAFLVVMLCMPDHIWGSITSIGRVITPVYPCVILALSRRDSAPARAILSATLLLGLGVAFALALNVHRFHLA